MDESGIKESIETGKKVLNAVILNSEKVFKQIFCLKMEIERRVGKGFVTMEIK